jgi:beta-lactamase superfamily II metal-dependent hydrolase
MTTRDLAIEVLPARHGDAILLEWPDTDGGDHATRRLLVDCGPAGAYTGIAQRLSELGPPRLDLLVLTHVDADHIEGTILLVNDAALALDIGEVWYNGYPQLADELAAPHGEILGALISQRGLPWNVAFCMRAAKASESGEPLTRIELPGGLALTVLAPAQSDLRALHDYWVPACKEAGLTVGSVEEALRLLHAKRKLNPRSSYLSDVPMPNVEQLARDRRGNDMKIPNRSSIVLLAEYKHRSVLLAGDSTPSVLRPALTRLLNERAIDRLELTDFKLPHHGSANNINREILQLAPAQRYLFSTDGSYFNHPDDTAVASVIRHGRRGAQLVFNYSNARTRRWDLPAVRDRYGYTTRYPEPDATGVRVGG